jgi:leucine-rich repeat protein SHOC2
MEQLKLTQIIEQARLYQSSSLYLSGQKLTSIPNSIGDITSLTGGVHLENNRLSKLPESIGNFTRLRWLYLSGNGLTNLPNSIGLLTNLTHLYLTDNNLTSLPESICNLSRLSHLTIRGNRLTMLPKNIGRLTNLTYLDLRDNQITELPKSIGNLFRLDALIIDLNPLTDLSMLQKLSARSTVLHRYRTKFSEWKPEWLFDETNTEIRRILIEHVGYEKICQDLGAVTLDTWREYTLLKIDGTDKIYLNNQFDGDVELIIEPMVLLKMTCPSTEHIHILRVPPEMNRVESAITWINHGIHPDQIAFAT